MNEEIIKRAVQEFADSGELKYEKAFELTNNSEYFFSVKIEKTLKNPLLKSRIGLEERANTISALPSGHKCGCCNGSGRA